LADRPLLGIEDGIAAANPALISTAAYDTVDAGEVKAVFI
jgi:hypothetical protein